MRYSKAIRFCDYLHLYMVAGIFVYRKLQYSIAFERCQACAGVLADYMGNHFLHDFPNPFYLQIVQGYIQSI